MQQQPLRVLVIDPDVERRDRLLRTLGANALPVATMAVAKPEEIVPTRKPAFDAALLCLSPGEGPVATVKALMAHLPHVPIVTVDGDVQCTDPLALVACGVQDHLPLQCTCCSGSPRLMSSLRWAVERTRLLESIEVMRKESEHRALHDPLTALPNRMLFRDRLRHMLAQSARHGTSFAVMFVDLDRFKQINDSLGHGIGDQLLVEVARRLEVCLRESDTCARWGGDEFAIVLEGVGKREHAMRVAAKALRVISQPLKVDGQELICSASIGMSLFPSDGKDEQTLMRHADRAMYRAKAGGGNAYRFFRKDMDEEALERLKVEHAMRRDFERGQLRLGMQAAARADPRETRRRRGVDPLWAPRARSEPRRHTSLP